MFYTRINGLSAHLSWDKRADAVVQKHRAAWLQADFTSP
jgi:hypothetical protein